MTKSRNIWKIALIFLSLLLAPTTFSANQPMGDDDENPDPIEREDGAQYQQYQQYQQQYPQQYQQQYQQQFQQQYQQQFQQQYQQYLPGPPIAPEHFMITSSYSVSSTTTFTDPGIFQVPAPAAQAGPEARPNTATRNIKRENDQDDASDNDEEEVRPEKRPWAAIGLGLTFKLPESADDIMGWKYTKKRKVEDLHEAINRLGDPFENVREIFTADKSKYTVHPDGMLFRTATLNNPLKRICFILAYQSDENSRNNAINIMKGKTNEANQQILEYFRRVSQGFGKINPFGLLFQNLRVTKDFESYREFVGSKVYKQIEDFAKTHGIEIKQ